MNREVYLLWVVINIAGVIVFVALATVGHLHADLQCRMAFRQLDDSGVINKSALSTFHPSYAFATADMSYRNTVPRFIATGPLDYAQRASVTGLFACLINLAGAILIYRRAGRRNTGHNGNIKGDIPN